MEKKNSWESLLLMKCAFQLNISFSCSRLSDVKIEFSPIAHTFKAYGFQPFYPMVTIIMTTITLVDIFLSKFSLDESQIHANAMSRIKWLFNFLVKRTFSLTFRLFARGFQMEKRNFVLFWQFITWKIETKYGKWDEDSNTKDKEWDEDKFQTYREEVEEWHVTMQKLPNQLLTS